VFAAGDVRHNSVKRVASAVGEGALAISSVHMYLRDEGFTASDQIAGAAPTAVDLAAVA
jgi:hypothetical protein